MRSRRAAVTLSFALALGCGGAGGGPTLRDEGALAMSVDGVPVDCLVEQTIRVGPTAELRVDGGGGVVRLYLDDREVTGDFAGDPLVGALTLAPEVPALLRATRDDTYGCSVRLVHRPDVEVALDRLRGESAHEVAMTRSDETGAPANVTLRVGTTGSTPSDRAADFLARHAGAFGAPAEQLVETEATVAPDGWATVRFAQIVDGLPGHRAGLDLELDPAGVVVSVHARLFVGLDRAPAFTSSEAEVSAGETAELTRVLYDPARPRAAWDVRGRAERRVVEDGSLEVLERTPTWDEARVEIHRPTPTPLPMGSRDSMTGHTLVAGGSSTGSAPAALSEQEQRVWTWAAQIAENVRAHSGQDGWSATTHPWVPISQVPTSGVRFMVEPMSEHPRVGWYSYGIAYLGTASTEEPAVVCHEYGHALHDTLRRQEPEIPALKEAVADSFWIFCDPWLTGRRNAGYRGQSFPSPGGRPDQTDYDAFLSAGLTADALYDAGYRVHDHTYFLSTPFYRLVESYDTPVERAEQLMYFTLGYNRASSTERFRQFRDAIVQQADAWAQSGRHGFTAGDACNVALAFREMNLDGEYGRAADASCGGPAGGEDRYICTRGYCPLCPVVNPNPCEREPTESEPHCVAPGLAGAGDRRICVGAIALTDEGCTRGQLRHCACLADGSWECPGECRDPGGDLEYCPEVAGAEGGFTRRTGSNACAASPGRTGVPGWLAIALAAWVAGRRRRRRCDGPAQR
ncbi:MAG: MYXO-CTERM sorting domain-containing protein [Myxococcota bacterium]|nr:MYXO-CTERM sorting domain-containing protein [Myxococcota bacterium]